MNKQFAAKAATSLGDDAIRTVLQHGLGTPEADAALSAAVTVTQVAEAAGCTAADYDNARGGAR